MKVDKSVTIEVDDVLDFIRQADNSDLYDIYELAKDKGDFETKFDFDDVSLYISDTDRNEVMDIFEECANRLGKEIFIEIETLADEMKMEFISSIWNKYTLEQLEQKLK